MKASRLARALAGVCLAMALPAPARADLAGDVDAVAARWRETANVIRLPPRVRSPDRPWPVVLPADALTPSHGCTTVAVLGAVSTAFVLRMPPDEPAGASEVFVPSVAGAASVARCGAARAQLSGLLIEARSPHAILEGLVGLSPARLPLPTLVLPHRDPGASPAMARPGRSIAPGPLAERADDRERLFKREGARDVDRRMLSADDRGSGRALLDLSPGCYRIAVLGAPAPGDPGGFHDVDSEVAWMTGELADADRTESPDAVLTVCTGERRGAVLAFAGGPPGVPALLIRARFDLPAGLPEHWGPDARGRIGAAMLARHAPSPPSPPVYQSIGVSGITTLPIEVEPGQCYLAALAPVQGGAKLLSLTASIGVRPALAHTGDPGGAVVVATCADIAERGTLDVEAHGSSLVWIAALWPMSRRRLGVESP